MTGKFISFEGGEGSGKSTQLSILHNTLKSSDLPCIKTREPGGSQGGEAIRNLLVNGSTDQWDPVAETFLFYAARIDHVNSVIKPALNQGIHVICDRFCDSTFVYQGMGKGLSESYINNIHRLALGNFMPDLTLILDIDPAIGLKRANARAGGETRFESMDFDFHQAVRAGFLCVARREPQRCVIIDAAQDKDSVRNDIFNAVYQMLGIHLTPAPATS